jgi:hypothetical protein
MDSREKNRHETAWRHVVDGWMLRTQVRRDLMVVLGMVLLTTVVLVALLTGFLAALVQHVLPTVLAKLIAGGALLGGSVGSGLAVRRRRNRAPR